MIDFGKRFQEQTGVEVDTVVIEPADYPTKVQTALLAGEKEPDIIVGEPKMLEDFFDAGFFEDLNQAPYNAQDYADQIVDYVWQVGQDDDGIQRAISYQITPAGIYYRRDIAKEVFGTDDPDEVGKLFKDYPTILETAQTLKDAGYRIFSSDAEMNVFSGDSAWVVDGTLNVAFLFQTLLDWRYGTFNQIIASIYRLFGANYTPVDWLGSSATAGVTIAVISSWMWFGNSFIMLMAGVQGISKDYFEAAAIDGAGRWTVFGKITLPLLRPMLLYVAITSLIGGLQMFDLPYLMSNPAGASYNSVYTVVMYLYKFGFTTGTTQTGYASAIAYVLFLIILAVSIIQLKVFNQDEEKAAARRAKKRASSKTK